MPKPSKHKLDDVQVSQVFRALAEEHIRTRRKERDGQQTWHRISELMGAPNSGIQQSWLPRKNTRGDQEDRPWDWRLVSLPEERLPEGPSLRAGGSGRVDAGGRFRLRQLLWASVPALALTAALGVFALDSDAPVPLDYRLVGGNSQGELITASQDPARLLFNDDSSIETDLETTLNVHVVEGRRLVARLSRGKVKVHVVPHPETNWRFLAGPYEVEVVGTRFDLGWDPEISRFALVMHEGRVVVAAPGQKPRAVATGEVLILDSDPNQAAVDPSLDPDAASPDSTARDGAENTGATRKPSGSGVPQPGANAKWAQKVAAGHFDEVVREARKQGIQQALGHRSAGELQALAQAARYTGDTDLAVQTWKTVRERFGKQTTGVQAAFFLGRIYDQLGRSAEALTWFDTYLTEAPGGLYASETLGRKLTLVRRVGGEGKARDVAKEYLRRFPHGPYADTARDMLLND